MTGTQQPPACAIERTEMPYPPVVPGRTRCGEKARALHTWTRAGGPGRCVDTSDLPLRRKRLHSAGRALARFRYRVYLINVNKSNGRKRCRGNQGPTRFLVIVKTCHQGPWSIQLCCLLLSGARFLRHRVNFVDRQAALSRVLEACGGPGRSCGCLRDDQ